MNLVGVTLKIGSLFSLDVYLSVTPKWLSLFLLSRGGKKSVTEGKQREWIRLLMHQHYLIRLLLFCNL